MIGLRSEAQNKEVSKRRGEIPLEASHRHLPKTLWHRTLQKVRGDIDRLIGHGGKQPLKNTPTRLGSQREK